MSEDTAHVIATVMGELLDRAEVAPNEHFFDAGGTSIMAVHLVAALRDRGLSGLSLLDVLREPTPSGLARRVDDRADALS